MPYDLPPVPVVEGHPETAFHSYSYSEQDGFGSVRVLPIVAFYHPDLKEFVLSYEAVRQATLPDEMLLDLLQSTSGRRRSRGMEPQGVGARGIERIMMIAIKKWLSTSRFLK